ncbi:conserved Plasmodium protein, unknown function [Plasmodium gallinaceum]|uniref:Uncharacterized protein n=1 Tax=Plasmodium gallinaceum TaxID=5849 RepID=A0A1J1GW70_PLAGA|nr:conserved Plasmodium protein, unknown function [Plasmodium gallinaceum]CRG96573.1 conserved Plasmodium protein, unknown function [Plasmodium gallinaceum]
MSDLYDNDILKKCKEDINNFDDIRNSFLKLNLQRDDNKNNTIKHNKKDEIDLFYSDKKYQNGFLTEKNKFQVNSFLEDLPSSHNSTLSCNNNLKNIVNNRKEKSKKIESDFNFFYLNKDKLKIKNNFLMNENLNDNIKLNSPLDGINKINFIQNLRRYRHDNTNEKSKDKIDKLEHKKYFNNYINKLKLEYLYNFKFGNDQVQKADFKEDKKYIRIVKNCTDYNNINSSKIHQIEELKKSKKYNSIFHKNNEIEKRNNSTPEKINNINANYLNISSIKNNLHMDLNYMNNFENIKKINISDLNNNSKILQQKYIQSKNESFLDIPLNSNSYNSNVLLLERTNDLFSEINKEKEYFNISNYLNKWINEAKNKENNTKLLEKQKEKKCFVNNIKKNSNDVFVKSLKDSKKEKQCLVGTEKIIDYGKKSCIKNENLEIKNYFGGSFDFNSNKNIINNNSLKNVPFKKKVNKINTKLKIYENLLNFEEVLKTKNNIEKIIKKENDKSNKNKENTDNEKNMLYLNKNNNCIKYTQHIIKKKNSSEQLFPLNEIDTFNKNKETKKNINLINFSINFKLKKNINNKNSNGNLSKKNYINSIFKDSYEKKSQLNELQNSKYNNFNKISINDKKEFLSSFLENDNNDKKNMYIENLFSLNDNNNSNSETISNYSSQFCHEENKFLYKINKTIDTKKSTLQLKNDICKPEKNENKNIYEEITKNKKYKYIDDKKEVPLEMKCIISENAIHETQSEKNVIIRENKQYDISVIKNFNKEECGNKEYTNKKNEENSNIKQVCEDKAYKKKNEENSKSDYVKENIKEENKLKIFNEMKKEMHEDSHKTNTTDYYLSNYRYNLRDICLNSVNQKFNFKNNMEEDTSKIIEYNELNKIQNSKIDENIHSEIFYHNNIKKSKEKEYNTKIIQNKKIINILQDDDKNRNDVIKNEEEEVVNENIKSIYNVKIRCKTNNKTNIEIENKINNENEKSENYDTYFETLNKENSEFAYENLCNENDSNKVECFNDETNSENIKNEIDNENDSNKVECFNEIINNKNTKNEIDNENESNKVQHLNDEVNCENKKNKTDNENYNKVECFNEEINNKNTKNEIDNENESNKVQHLNDEVNCENKKNEIDNENDSNKVECFNEEINNENIKNEIDNENDSNKVECFNEEINKNTKNEIDNENYNKVEHLNDEINNKDTENEVDNENESNKDEHLNDEINNKNTRNEEDNEIYNSIECFNDEINSENIKNKRDNENYNKVENLNDEINKKNTKNEEDNENYNKVENLNDETNCENIKNEIDNENDSNQVECFNEIINNKNTKNEEDNENYNKVENLNDEINNKNTKNEEDNENYNKVENLNEEINKNTKNEIDNENYNKVENLNDEINNKNTKNEVNNENSNNEVGLINNEITRENDNNRFTINNDDEKIKSNKNIIKIDSYKGNENENDYEIENIKNEYNNDESKNEKGNNKNIKNKNENNNNENLYSEFYYANENNGYKNDKIEYEDINKSECQTQNVNDDNNKNIYEKNVNTMDIYNDKKEINIDNNKNINQNNNIYFGSKYIKKKMYFFDENLGNDYLKKDRENNENLIQDIFQENISNIENFNYENITNKKEIPKDANLETVDIMLNEKVELYQTSEYYIENIKKETVNKNAQNELLYRHTEFLVDNVTIKNEKSQDNFNKIIPYVEISKTSYNEIIKEFNNLCIKINKYNLFKYLNIKEERLNYINLLYNSFNYYNKTLNVNSEKTNIYDYQDKKNILNSDENKKFFEMKLFNILNSNLIEDNDLNTCNNNEISDELSVYENKKDFNNSSQHLNEKLNDIINEKDEISKSSESVNLINEVKSNIIHNNNINIQNIKEMNNETEGEILYYSDENDEDNICFEDIKRNIWLQNEEFHKNNERQNLVNYIKLESVKCIILFCYLYNIKYFQGMQDMVISLFYLNLETYEIFCVFEKILHYYAPYLYLGYNLKNKYSTFYININDVSNKCKIEDISMSICKFNGKLFRLIFQFFFPHISNYFDMTINENWPSFFFVNLNFSKFTNVYCLLYIWMRLIEIKGDKKAATCDFILYLLSFFRYKLKIIKRKLYEKINILDINKNSSFRKDIIKKSEPKLKEIIQINDDEDEKDKKEEIQKQKYDKKEEKENEENQKNNEKIKENIKKKKLSTYCKHMFSLIFEYNSSFDEHINDDFKIHVDNIIKNISKIKEVIPSSVIDLIINYNSIYQQNEQLLKQDVYMDENSSNNIMKQLDNNVCLNIKISDLFFIYNNYKYYEFVFIRLLKEKIILSKLNYINISNIEIENFAELRNVDEFLKYKIKLRNVFKNNKKILYVIYLNEKDIHHLNDKEVSTEINYAYKKNNEFFNNDQNINKNKFINKFFSKKDVKENGINKDNLNNPILDKKYLNNFIILLLKNNIKYLTILNENSNVIKIINEKKYTEEEVNYNKSLNESSFFFQVIKKVKNKIYGNNIKEDSINNNISLEKNILQDNNLMFVLNGSNFKIFNKKKIKKKENYKKKKTILDYKNNLRKKKNEKPQNKLNNKLEKVLNYKLEKKLNRVTDFYSKKYEEGDKNNLFNSYKENLNEKYIYFNKKEYINVMNNLKLKNYLIFKKNKKQKLNSNIKLNNMMYSRLKRKKKKLEQSKTIKKKKEKEYKIMFNLSNNREINVTQRKLYRNINHLHNKVNNYKKNSTFNLSKENSNKGLNINLNNNVDIDKFINSKDKRNFTNENKLNFLELQERYITDLLSENLSKNKDKQECKKLFVHNKSIIN